MSRIPKAGDAKNAQSEILIGNRKSKIGDKARSFKSEIIPAEQQRGAENAKSKIGSDFGAVPKW